ncbi:heterokaryon incompatibility protein-domain-containing protein [Xylariaceae sp. FL1272]|nr:heterokaryon incompatibility protein-domain-containing protein [Xylariaceae sp. FL1272]
MHSAPAKLPSSSMHLCLSICLASHESCREDAETGWLPSRLIDVRQMALRLSTDISRAEDHQYVALSHEWGTESFLTLTRDNLDDLKLHLPYHNLRPTFQEAINITREIGINFLWIDSLCIVQGKIHQSEWHREAGTMASVYRNAIVTIAISNDVEPENQFGNKSVWVGHPMTDSVILAQDPKRSLTGRAWALQENLLAPRTAHLVRGKSEFIWKCRELTVKQMASHLFRFPGEEPDKIWKKRLGHSSCHLLWEKIVSFYSMCSLTDQNDKLVALSGLAKTFAGVIDAKYVAGIWDRYLAQGLSWCAIGHWEDKPNLITTKRTSRYRAPSWSWASVDGFISFELKFYLGKIVMPLAFFENSNMVPTATDEFGALQSGWITIRGRLFPIGISDNRMAGSRGKYMDDFLTANVDEELSSEYGQLFLVVLGKTKIDSVFSPEAYSYVSLLVCQKTRDHSAQNPAYQRIGITRIFIRKIGKRWINASTVQHDCKLEATTLLKPWCSCIFYPRSSDNRSPREFSTADFEKTPMQSITLV